MSGRSHAEISLDPSDVYFTHSRIRPYFTGVGCAIEHTIAEVEAGRLCVEDIPLITVLHNGSHYFSLNNRRLYMLKHLKRVGLLRDGVCKVRLKKMLEREKAKYTVQNCVLQATLMGRGAEEEEEEELAEGMEELVLAAGTGGSAPRKDAKQKAVSITNSATANRSAIVKVADLGAAAQAKLKALLKLVDKKGRVEQCQKQLEALAGDKAFSEEELRFMQQELGL